MPMNNVRPKVSIIIPTYNRGENLRICLNSLVEQTYKNFEVIICDDGSTDDTKNVIQDFVSKLDVVYDYDINWGGPARPRNRGIRISKGDFIAFLDSDDWWYPNKLEVCLPYLSDYDLVYHDLDIYNSTGKSNGVAKGRVLIGNISRDLVVNGNGINNSSVLIKKSIVNLTGEITEDTNLVAVEDFDYWIRIAKVTDRFKYINQSLGAYWEGENISYSTKQIERAKSLLDKYISELSVEDQKLAILAHHFNSARIFHNLGFYAEAKKSYLEALDMYSLVGTFKGIVGYIMCCFKIK
jgi:glycosyltransferase involved in cell wall biosynthesis